MKASDLSLRGVDVIRIFCGIDDRERVGLSVFSSSVWRRASQPVSITQIGSLIPSDGATTFTASRLLVPSLCDYRGWALWLDGSDMLCLGDVAELWGLRYKRYAVQVVKHDYRTNHSVKFLGQANPDYPRKNWASVMLMNCSHPAWGELPEPTTGRANRLDWLSDDLIGELPSEWNHLVGEPNQCEEAEAKLLHFTLGIPEWPPYNNWFPSSDMWRRECAAMLYFEIDPRIVAGRVLG